MKKIIITRRFFKASEEKASKTFDAKLNGNDELYSQSKLIECAICHVSWVMCHVLCVIWNIYFFYKVAELVN